MSVSRASQFAVSMIAVAALLQGCSRPEPADLIAHNGQVLTVDENFSIHSAVVVKDGKIVAVGDEMLVRRYEAPVTIDLAGRTLLPGFMDTHVHIGASSPRSIELTRARSIEEVQELLRAKAQELGSGEWITGYGWDEALFAEQRNLHRRDLDVAAPDNPVVLTRAGSHSSVGNSLALRIAGIDRNTPDPASGLIEKDANGEPNGIIRERSDLYYQHVPPDTPETLRPSLIEAFRSMLPLGITSVMEAFSTIDDEPIGAGGTDTPDGPFGNLHTYRQIKSIYDEYGEELPRATLYIHYPGAERLRQFPYKTGHGDERLRLGPIGETPVDGGFTGPTAWTREDYKGRPGFRGQTFYTREQVEEMVSTSAALGWQLGLHAIGDAAIEMTADVYAQELIRNPRQDHRWFLSHFTMLPPETTLEQMAQQQIGIAQQPNFLYNLEGRYNDTLDGDRLAHNNPVGTPLRSGIFMAFGTDNLPIDPRVGLYAAVTRQGPSGTAYALEEEAIPIREAIRLYTAAGPYLTFEENIKGTLEPGKLADMVVLDRDPLTIPPDELLTMNVDLTIVGGKIVYDRATASH